MYPLTASQTCTFYPVPTASRVQLLIANACFTAQLCHFAVMGFCIKQHRLSCWQETVMLVGCPLATITRAFKQCCLPVQCRLPERLPTWLPHL